MNIKRMDIIWNEIKLNNGNFTWIISLELLYFI